MDETRRREPIDPFAGRQPLKLMFAPRESERRRLPGDELYCARTTDPNVPPSSSVPEPDEAKPDEVDTVAATEECRSAERPSASPSRRVRVSTPESATVEPDEARTESAEEYVLAKRSLAASRLPVRVSEPAKGASLSELALAAVLGQDEEVRDRALFRAVTRIIGTKESLERLEKELAPVMQIIYAARGMGADLAVPAPLAYALSMRREMDRRGLELTILPKTGGTRERGSAASVPDRPEEPVEEKRNGDELLFIGVSADGRLEIGGRTAKRRRARNAYMAERMRRLRTAQREGREEG